MSKGMNKETQLTKNKPFETLRKVIDLIDKVGGEAPASFIKLELGKAGVSALYLGHKTGYLEKKEIENTNWTLFSQRLFIPVYYRSEKLLPTGEREAQKIRDCIEFLEQQGYAVSRSTPELLEGGE